MQRRRIRITRLTITEYSPRHIRLVEMTDIIGRTYECQNVVEIDAKIQQALDQ